MIITKDMVGAYGNTTRYTIRNSITDTGASAADAIAWFDTLELATAVMRYMRGDSLSEDVEKRAIQAIRNVGCEI